MENLTPKNTAVDVTDLTLDSDSDELDVMNMMSPPTVTLDAKPAIRPRRSSENVGRFSSLKRTRTLSISAAENSGGQKRTKLESKKALTILINTKRSSIEAARGRWLARHQHLFRSLLPSSSEVFDNIQKDSKLSSDKTTYKPLHQLEEQPSLIQGGQMKDYQLQGLSFLVWMYHNGMNCILGDEMGLGKTLQTLSLFAYIKENMSGPLEPHLIICPLSVLSSWLGEAARWLPSFRTIRFHGVQTERNRLKNVFLTDGHKIDLCIATYESFVADDGWFKSRRWTYCVLDEGHKIKNSETNVSHKVQSVGALYRLILTGTPIQNNLLELWGLLHWLYPTIFTPTTERLFKDSWDLSRGMYSLPFLNAAQNLLSTVMLRRTKTVVEMSIPPREELTVFIPFSEAQRFWTMRLLTKMDTMNLEQIFTSKIEDDEANKGRLEVHSHLAQQIKQGSTGQGNQWKKLMNLLMQLRKICDHPYLILDAEPDPYSIGEHLVAASSKMVIIDKILADVIPKGERVLIFSQWTSMLDLLEDFMTLRDISYARLDGQTRRPRRALDIKLFQQEVSPYQVYLLSTTAGGLGINLTKATTVIMCDSDWNPQNDLQAIARAHRVGQTKTVKAYRLICQGSVEDQMMERIRRKLYLSVKIMGSDQSGPDSEGTSLRSGELMEILRKGSSVLSRAGDGLGLAQFLEAPLDEILNASRTRADARDAKMKHEMKVEDDVDQKQLANAEEEQFLLAGVAQVQSRLFEGKVVARSARNNKEIAREWRQLQKRAHVDRLVMIDGIPVVSAHVGVAPLVESKPAAAPAKMQKRKYESEDYCLHCRDGGELVLCSHCPRVFHPKCIGMSAAQVRRGTVVCTQHSCWDCDRSTSDSGGMLFRCQTCAKAFCEDCIPNGEIDAVGDTLPEFLLLGFGAQSTAYYIRCHGCHERFANDPDEWEAWQEEMRQTQKKLNAVTS